MSPEDARELAEERYARRVPAVSWLGRVRAGSVGGPRGRREGVERGAEVMQGEVDDVHVRGVKGEVPEGIRIGLEKARRTGISKGDARWRDANNIGARRFGH